MADPSKRFIYVEMAFFAIWWKEQSDFMKAQVKTLVQEGCMQFVVSYGTVSKKVEKLC